MKTRFRVISFLLALLLLASVLVGCASTADPLNILKDALERTLMERFGGNYLTDTVQALRGGMVSLRYGGADADLLDLPVDTAELNLWLNADELTAVADGFVTVGGVYYDGKLLLNRDRLVVSSVAFLGSNDLSVEFDTLSSDLANSIFRNNSGSEFMIPWLGSTAARDITALYESVFTVWDSLQEWYLLSDALLERFLECLVDNLSSHCYTKDGTVRIGDSGHPIVITNDVLSRALRDLHSSVVEDSDLCAELRRIATLRDKMLSAAAGNGTKVTDWSVRVESFLQSQQIVNEWCGFIDNQLPQFSLELIAVVDDIVEQASAVLSVAPAQGQPLAHVATFTMDLTDEDTNIIGLTCGGESRTLTYRVTEDGWSNYRAEILYQVCDAATGRSKTRIEGELSADRSTDRYELTLIRNGTETRCFRGSFDRKIDGFTFTVDSAALNGEPKKLSFALEVDVDAAPTFEPDGYKKLFTLSHAEFAQIYPRAVAALANLRASLSNVPETPLAWMKRLLHTLGLRDEELPPTEE